MEKQREFRRDYTSLNKKEKFMCGDIATKIERRMAEVKFQVNGLHYSLPTRDFIVVTKPINQIEY